MDEGGFLEVLRGRLGGVSGGEDTAPRLVGAPPSRPIRVVLVEDHGLVRAGMRELMEAEEDMVVVGEAADTDSGVEEVRRSRPDVAVVDMQLPGGGGIELLKAIAESAPEVRSLVVSAYDDYAHVTGALEAGAAGYIPKTASRAELLDAIRTVAKGSMVLGPEAARHLQRRWRDPGLPAVELTERELDVLRLVAKGCANKDIARELGLGLRTVEGYVSNILAKLGVTSRTEAALWAMQHHIAPAG